MKFEVGQVLTVIPLEEVKKREKSAYGNYKFDGKTMVSDMLKYCGKKVTVERLFGNGKMCYIEEENYGWTHDMFEEDKESEMKEFTKADLQVGMVVRLSNGETAYVGNFIGGLCIDWQNDCRALRLSEYGEKLNYEYENAKIFDIIEVYGLSHYEFKSTKVTTTHRQLLWKRNEKTPQEIKIEEIESTIENLKKQVEELKGE